MHIAIVLLLQPTTRSVKKIFFERVAEAASY